MDSGANIHVCTYVYLFASYQVGRNRALLMGNGSRVHVLSAGTVNLKFTSGEDSAIEGRAACALHQEKSC
jgi:hypothetical protein